MLSFEDYRRYDALGLAELVRSKQVSAGELLEAAIARCEQVNPKINAVVRPLYERARQRARQALQGPFAGVPFLLKDLINELEGAPTSNGSAFYKDHVSQRDSELVRRYQAAGLVIFGKTNTPELGLTPWTEPALFGPARNPWNLQRTTGGSSGGSGAAVAAGIVPVANGGDGGGSIRVPASACGLVGLKPTRGRIPTGPVRVDMWQGAATEHVLSRSVRDTAAMLDATGAYEPGSGHVFPQEAPFLEQIRRAPRRLRIAFSSQPMMGETMDPECVKGVEATAKLLQSLGHEVVEDAPRIPREEFTVAFIRMICMETAADFAAGAQAMQRKFDPSLVEAGTEALRRIGAAMSAECAGLARRTLDLHTRRVAQWFESYDLLLQPTVGMRPFVIGERGPGVMDRFQMALLNHLPIASLANNPALLLGVGKKTFEWMTNTGVYNVTGQPSISLPLHWSDDGLPVGMMLTARYAQDGLLLQAAAQLEQARPWFDRVPTL